MDTRNEPNSSLVTNLLIAFGLVGRGKPGLKVKRHTSIVDAIMELKP